MIENDGWISEVHVIQLVRIILDFVIKYEHAPMILFFFDIAIKYRKSLNKGLTLPRQYDKVCAV